MDGNELKQTLRQGGRVYGTMFSTTRVAQGDERLPEMGLDYVIVDTEHAAYNRSEVATWMTRLKSLGITPFVRVPIPTSHYITMALDGGAEGVLAPYVETLEQVEEIVAACKWLPLKGDAVMRLVRVGQFPSEETRRYLEERNRKHVLFLGVESVRAIENLAALISVPGIDAVFIGPHDLSIQLGIPSQFQHPRYVEAEDQIHRVCQAHGIPIVPHCFQREMTSSLVQAGMRCILYGNDSQGIGNEMRENIAYLRNLPTAQAA